MSAGPYADRPAPPLEARGVSIGYGAEPVVHDLDLLVAAGRLTALVGPNGCGKSTVLRALARLMRVQSGTVLLHGTDIGDVAPREVARRLAVLPQEPVAPLGITVAELVWRGRHPHRRLGQRPTRADELAIAGALLRTDTAALADRAMESLSGGQRQRVWIAMALAQGTDVLLLDEPTNHLDIAHQLEVLDLLADLRDGGTTVLVVLHDLTLAARYADTVVALREGRLVASGETRSVLTPAFLEEVFGVTGRVLDDPDTGAPVVLPRGRRARARAAESS